MSSLDLSTLVDYHIHTQRCGHASGTAEDYLAQARKIGLGELGFSEHLFLYWLPEEQRDPELGMPEADFDPYVAEVRRLQVTSESVAVRLALEVDYIPGCEETLRAILARHAWDYLLGSVHFIDGWGFDDSRYIDGYARWDVNRLYERYFELLLKAAGTGLFDVMGHLDLPKKFGHRPSKTPTALFETVAASLARADVCIEVSTAGLRKPVGEIYPSPQLLRLCRDSGVPATLSSDSHHPSDVAKDYPASVQLLKESGYTEFAAFDGRRRSFRPLP